jgi:hypothetical protein
MPKFCTLDFLFACGCRAQLQNLWTPVCLATQRIRASCAALYAPRSSHILLIWNIQYVRP